MSLFEASSRDVGLGPCLSTYQNDPLLKFYCLSSDGHINGGCAMTNESKTVFLYARTSTKTDQTPETQLVALRDYCARMGYKIKGIYEDYGFSGKNEQRPAFERLMADIRTNKIKCIVVYKLDRIGRSLQHLLNLFDEFQNRGVEFISMTQNINTQTPEGKMFWQLLGVFSEFERSLTVDRVMSGLRRAVKQGKKLGRPKGSKDTKRRNKSGYYLRWAKRSANK
jgi:DNA invertase Pin-like site-specific DNA recombinase